MSVTLMAEALRYAAEHDLAPPRRLVLYVMADAGDDDGRLWHGQKRLQRLTGLSLSTIRKAIREFEDLGILTTTIRVREEGRGRTSNLYVLSFHATADGDRSHELPPPPGDRSADQPPGDGGEPHRPSADQPPGDGGPIDGGTVREPSVGTTQAERAKSKVGGKVVTDDEFSVVTEIVAAFNAAAGTSYQPDSIDHLRPIVGRIREFPDLTGDDHRGIIAAVFRLPWWSGAPGPQVIYGSKGQFERSIETWRASGPGPLRLVDAAAGTGHPPTPDERPAP